MTISLVELACRMSCLKKKNFLEQIGKTINSRSYIVGQHRIIFFLPCQRLKQDKRKEGQKYWQILNFAKRNSYEIHRSPHKQHFVVGKLARSVGSVSSSSKKSISAESEARRELVHTFYRTDDVSWQAPGKKDCIIIREATEAGERIKQTQHVRYMIMSLREAWNKFKEQHSTPKMCLSKFCELRPPNVKLFDQLPHQVCLCSYHEIVRLLLVGLGEHTSLSAGFSSYIEQVTCDF